MYNIPEYSNYYLTEDHRVCKKVNNKEVTRQAKGNGTFKLKNDQGEWKTVFLTRILASVFPPKPPEGFKQVPGYESLFINLLGQVWSSPTVNTPLGKILTPVTSCGYPRVSTGEYGTVAIHQLLALTYIDSKYIDKGLCVMHLDDDKLNYELSNLKVGTYSENIKAAYDSGLNPGNGLKK